MFINTQSSAKQDDSDLHSTDIMQLDSFLFTVRLLLTKISDTPSKIPLLKKDASKKLQVPVTKCSSINIHIWPL